MHNNLIKTEKQNKTKQNARVQWVTAALGSALGTVELLGWIVLGQVLGLAVPSRSAGRWAGLWDGNTILHLSTDSY